MTRVLFRLALLVPLAAVAGTDLVTAQAPARGGAGQQARAANTPAPREADGHIVLGNTKTLKGVWIGGNLGFCNGNTVAAPASLNPGATAGAAGRGAPSGVGAHRTDSSGVAAEPSGARIESAGASSHSCAPAASRATDRSGERGALFPGLPDLPLDGAAAGRHLYNGAGFA